MLLMKIGLVLAIVTVPVALFGAVLYVVGEHLPEDPNGIRMDPEDLLTCENCEKWAGVCVNPESEYYHEKTTAGTTCNKCEVKF